MDVGDLRDYDAGERWSLDGRAVPGHDFHIEAEVDVDALRAMAQPVQPS
jgi:hypothetical protein